MTQLSFKLPLFFFLPLRPLCPSYATAVDNDKCTCWLWISGVSALDFAVASLLSLYTLPVTLVVTRVELFSSTTIDLLVNYCN